MRKTAFLVCVMLAVLAAVACKNSPTGPTANLPGPSETASTTSTDNKTPMTINEAYVGTWRATKAEFLRASAPNVLTDRRDLVAEGGTVILDLNRDGTYSVSVTMPGEKTGVSTGLWHYHTFWGKPQIDFYFSSTRQLEWGEIPGFYVILSADTLTLWDGNSNFLPFDFGYNAPPGAILGVLAFEFTRT